MTIKLLKTNRGVVIERSAVFADVYSSAELSFILPDNGQYIAVFIDENGHSYQVKILDNKAILPQELTKPHLLQLYVIKVADNGSALQTFACEPLKINSLNNARKDVFELIGALSENDVRMRISEIEEWICAQEQKNAEYEELAERLQKAVNRFNCAVDAINSMQDRLTALEKNYDPSLIE